MTVVDVGPNITSMLERLAAQIGTTADKVFPWYVQQAYAEGLIFLILLAVAIVVSVIAVAYGIAKGDWKFGEPGNLAAVLTIMGCVLLAVSTVALLVGGPKSATKVLNPQYHAMKMLTRDVGNMVGK